MARSAYHVYEGFQRKDQCLDVAVDLEDVYNRAQFKLLMELLAQYGVILRLTRWLTAALQERKVVVGLHLHTPATDNGTPQGSPLSKVLCNIYTKELVDLNSTGLNWVLTLADDRLIHKTASGTHAAAAKSVIKVPRDRSEINPSKVQALWYTLNKQSSGTSTASSLL